MNKYIRKFEKEIKNNSRIDIIVLFLGTLTIYVHNLSPGVYGLDSGDFLSAALSKGVPHASGYPLYTMLGIIFTSLPFSVTAAWKFGLVSAIFGSLAVSVFYLLILELTKNRLISIVSSLSLAFTYTFWIYSEVVEVFSMHAFFVIILIYLSIKYHLSRKISYFYLLSLFSGLSLTNNQSVLSLFPAIAFLVIFTNLKQLLSLKVIVYGIFFFLLGLLPYIYIPLSATKMPFINFGKAVTLKNFFFHVTRQTYGWGFRAKIPLDPKIAALPFYHYWSTYIGDLVVPTAIIGFLTLIKQKRAKILVFLSLCFIISGPVLLSIALKRPIYSLMKVAVLERFYLQFVVIIMMFSAYGLYGLKTAIEFLLVRKSLKKLVLKLFSVAIIVIPISSYLVNSNITNLNNVMIGDNLGYDTLGKLPKDTILLIQDDNSVFNSLYLQTAYDFRKDVYIPGRHDGMKQLLLYSGLSEEEFDVYSTKYGNTMDDRNIVFKALVNMMSKDVNVYSDFTFSDINLVEEERGEVLFVPYGLTFKLYFKEDYKLSLEEYLEEVDYYTSDYHVSGFKKNRNIVSNNVALSSIQRIYAQAYFRIAKFIPSQYSNTEYAIKYLQKAAEIDPVIGN